MEIVKNNWYINGKKMNKWEYFFYTVRNLEFLNPTSNSPLSHIPQFGDEGLELVSVVAYDNTTMFAFKRPKEEENVLSK